ncbi:hypothetical protein EJ05DRAFT_515037 [Pseudovirgaria hyperparasitica]|uniref:Uncharacterized protein n=1 Tax=Pseudovirgaria hyperparasitica TaxID=470096 RepID=A0A6A6VSK8_9PEZI|nr:uncharacterized protein EJ05DRAFT_515037 [Pseudovirgaria hyperparasitica]KAF2753203.1 hypothetical protein EJ05DRAFT_515037 [Pseudovirgaria hyperparasitica]
MSPTFSLQRPDLGTLTSEDDKITTALSTMNARLPEIKSLFLTRRFKNCAAACETLLQDTTWHKDTNNTVSQIYECYLNFYAGLSYDALARNMAHAAPSRVAVLRQAEIKYLAAEANLPQPASTPLSHYESDEGLTADDDDVSPESSVSHSTRNSINSYTSHYSAYSLNYLLHSETMSTLMRSDTMNTFDPTSRIIDHYYSSDRVPKPSPLHIRKDRPAVRLSAVSFHFPVTPTSSLGNDPFSDILTPLSAALDHPDDFAETASTFSPSEPDCEYPDEQNSHDRSGADSPTLPPSPMLAVTRPQHTTSIPQFPAPPSPPPSPLTPSANHPSRSASSSRGLNSPLPSPRTSNPRLSVNSALFAHVLAYNQTLRSFSTMLYAHIAAVRDMQKEAPVAAVRIAKTKGSSVNQWREQESHVVREAKRTELVQRALARERFRPERYMELCQKALSEI